MLRDAQTVKVHLQLIVYNFHRDAAHDRRMIKIRFASVSCDRFFRRFFCGSAKCEVALFLPIITCFDCWRLATIVQVAANAVTNKRFRDKNHSKHSTFLCRSSSFQLFLFLVFEPALRIMNRHLIYLFFFGTENDFRVWNSIHSKSFVCISGSFDFGFGVDECHETHDIDGTRWFQAKTFCETQPSL